MSGHDGFGWLRAFEMRLLQAKAEELGAAQTKPTREDRAKLRELAAGKIVSGSHLTRDEVAAYLDVSVRKVQRMEVSGRLARCPGLGSVVRYAARDVLRLASAK
jgi:hypothetical protein